jgi:hypothetical protein
MRKVRGYFSYALPPSLRVATFPCGRAPAINENFINVLDMFRMRFICSEFSQCPTRSGW